MSNKILFIEDEEALQRALSDTLIGAGYEVLQAIDGDAGLEIARKSLPDIILLDLILPKKNGFEVLQELKSDPATKDIPVIVLTNLEGSEDVDRVIEGGAAMYLVKANYSVQDIVEKVRGVLEKRL